MHHTRLVPAMQYMVTKHENLRGSENYLMGSGKYLMGSQKYLKNVGEGGGIVGGGTANVCILIILWLCRTVQA
jgi:hypothetical protein